MEDIKYLDIPFWKHMGIRIKEMQPGHVKLTIKAKEELLQMYGVMHGGATASLIDTAIAMSAWSLHQPGYRVVTVEMKINYFAPIYPNEIIEAAAEVVNNGNTLVVGKAEVKNQEGKLVAYATATFMLLKN